MNVLKHGAGETGVTCGSPGGQSSAFGAAGRPSEGESFAPCVFRRPRVNPKTDKVSKRQRILRRQLLRKKRRTNESL